MPKNIDGLMKADGLKVAIVATRFNDFIVDRLVGGAMDFLTRHGMNPDDACIIRVPGAFEMPLVCKKVAESGKYDGIVAVGCVIRGGTPHFDYVCGECAKGVAQVELASGTPIGFGLLTCDNLEQAIDRAGVKAGNKGVEAASAMLETVRVLEQL
ncbi:MAG: 6,7-dimethyl-8-ribityllumazine synthase [Desulfovibrio sp.]|jgi:6,7-dimethyl-8-ribityllumazine synthase|nr:6,7-dimethyl-8-ribityllumazine synthase [Desulfovibrio sp.]MBR5051231.1 6,7-dimethyl-8-ribityllumazine synthase [Desulfovibrio sp.]MBR6466796.1 6,7-dimethyl-8-ribityllumazine synthase [Desulfovibrio sp.]